LKVQSLNDCVVGDLVGFIPFYSLFRKVDTMRVSQVSRILEPSAKTSALSPAERERGEVILSALLSLVPDAQADVESYLGKDLTVTEQVEFNKMQSQPNPDGSDNSTPINEESRKLMMEYAEIADKLNAEQSDKLFPVGNNCYLGISFRELGHPRFYIRVVEKPRTSVRAVSCITTTDPFAVVPTE